MSDSSQLERQLDLQPHPRILPMLGEIHLKQWQCVAELVDNSIDSFITAQRAGRAIHAPEIVVNTPLANRADVRIAVSDNGPGMEPDMLENALRAGWSGNDPIGNLGLFGMGFNIATARLGSVTDVWTTRRGDAVWHGVRIDFDELIRKRTFRAPLQTRPKLDREQSGTQVIVTRLKPEQREWFGSARSRTSLSQELGRVYSALLHGDARPILLRLRMNDEDIKGRRHCIWDADRVVDTSRLGPIGARKNFDVRLDDRSFCQRCWQWLASGERKCPQCEQTDAVVSRQRRIHGWLGVQRYLHQSQFGLDFLRNGRKIEVGSKDLFVWESSDGISEKEYPIDDPRNRGRIVGEIHLDHCRVTYTKDRFDRTDPGWEDMIQAVRGDGPLRPEKAAELGRGENLTPLFVLYQAFRRSNPKTKKSGGWTRLLVVPDNDRAQQMAERFYEGDPQYQTDDKWFALVEEADRQILHDSPSGEPESPGDFWEGGPIPTAVDAPVPAGGPPPSPPVRREIPSLTRDFVDDASEVRWAVRGFEVAADDPILGGRAWTTQQSRAGQWEFFVDPRNEAFRSATLTPTDALLAELAHHAADVARGRPQPIGFGQILMSLRNRYAVTSKLDPATMNTQAGAILAQVAKSLTRNVEPADAMALFGELPGDEQDAIWERSISRDARRADMIRSGRFLEVAPRATLRRFFEAHTDLFMDGKYWDVPYSSLDFGREDVTNAAREQIKRLYISLLTDAIWLAEQDPSELAVASRTRLLRAALALEILESEVAGEEETA